MLDLKSQATTEAPRPDWTRAATLAGTPALAMRLANRTPVEIRRRGWMEFLCTRAVPIPLGRNGQRRP